MTMSKRDQRIKQAYGRVPTQNLIDLIEFRFSRNIIEPTPKRLSILESLKPLRDKLPKNDFKDTLENLLESSVKPEESEKFKALETFAENLSIAYKQGALDATMGVITAIFSFQEIKKHEEGRNRTRAATFARKGKILPGLKDKQKKAFFSKVYTFFQEVEDKWHPKGEQREQPRSRGRKSKKRVLENVYKTHQEEIEKAAEESGIPKEESNRTFYRLFDRYTERTIETNNGLTANGYKKEKRAARSEESKQKARDTALKNVEKKRWKHVSFLNEASKAYDKYYKEMTEQGSIPDSNHEH